MDRLELLPGNHESNAAPIVQRELVVGVARNDCAAGRVRQQILQSGWFTSVHRRTETIDLWETQAESSRLARDNPFLEEADLRALDEHGLIRPGAVVRDDMLLASILQVDNLAPKQRTTPGMQWVRNGSREAPPGWDGARVIAVERRTRRELGRGAPGGLLERIEVALRAERPLEAGDVLSLENTLVVVSGFADDNQMPSDADGLAADVVVSERQAISLGVSVRRFRRLAASKLADRAADAIRCRNVGPYSLISQRPLPKPPYGGLAVNTKQVAWLESRGLSALAAELAVLKCDDLANRPQVAALATAAPGSLLDSHVPGTPESLLQLRAWLMALGLEVALSDEGDHLSVGLRPATAAEIRRMAPGVVQRPETIHYRTYEDEKQGLFCPQAFGPSKRPRRRRFAHVDLAVPIVPRLWRIGRPSVLERLLGLSATDIEQVLQHRANLFSRDGALQVAERSNGESPFVQGAESLGTGAAAVRTLLLRIPPEHLPAGLLQRVEALTPDAIVVVPPDLRPLVRLDNGNFATHDINDLYRVLINRNNRLKKLIELKAPQVILDNEQRELQLTVDALQANSLLPDHEASWREGANERLVCALDGLLDAARLDRKPVDWSGQARIVSDEAIPQDRVLVPQAVYDTLRLSDELPILLTVPEGDGGFVARRPASHDDPVLRVSPQTLIQLGIELDAPTVCHVHRPVTTPGRDEALRLLAGDPDPAHIARPEYAWSDFETPADVVSWLMPALLDGRPMPLDSPRGRLIAGFGPVVIASDEQCPPTALHDTPRREVPIPPEQPTRRSQPTIQQIRDVIQAHVRPTCLFDARRTDEAPAAVDGRLGGLPYLPLDVPWPRSHDEPLPFLGQFPLDVARAAGVLPLNVPPGSLLSVFWGRESWQPGPCSVRCPIFIHTAEGAVLKSPDRADWEVGPLCRITPRIVQEAPAWQQMREILEWELEKPEFKILNDFQQQHWPQFPAAAEAIKIGGWPGWVQTPDCELPLLLQIASIEDADLMFGDCGSLYVFVEKEGSLTCFSQCY